MKAMKVSLGFATLLLLSAFGVAQVRETPALEHQVRQDLLTLPGLSVFDNLTFRVYGLTVLLEGQVTTPALKNSAEGLMRGINGVEGVDNHVEVLPVTRSDESIRIAALRAVYDDPNATPESMGPNPPIHIVVRNGSVMLEGVVRNEVERADAYTRAIHVPGVISVTNELQIVD